MKQLTVERKVYVADGREMAEMLGISQRRLQQLVAEDWVAGKIGRNEFDITQVISSFREYIRLKKGAA